MNQAGFSFAPPPDSWLMVPDSGAITLPSDGQALRKYQAEAVAAVLKQLAEFRSTIAVMPTGSGKCLGRGEKVMLATGHCMPVEDVLVGEELMGPGGSARRVLSVTSGVGPLFKLTPVKGKPWVCNDVHVLTLVHTETGEIEDVPLDQYVTKAKYWKHCRKMFRSSVEFCEYGSGVRTVDPYFLGLFLGDGSLRDTSLSVCKPDVEVREECERQAQAWGLQVHVLSEGTTSPQYQIGGGRCGGRTNPLGQALRNLGIDGNCKSKHVPHSYKVAPRGDRLAVLAGLLDSDGSLSGNGFDFISISPRLSDDVAFLARSLGLAAYVTPCRKSCQTGATGDYFRVSISGDTDLIPNRIPRKKAKPRQQKKDVLRTGFTVEEIGEGEYFGFELDGDGRFLLDDFTVTHNTRVAAELIRHWPGRAMMIAHRDELLVQARTRLASETGERVGLEQAQFFAGDERVVVGSIQTLCMPARLERWKSDDFGLIIVDEAHHSCSKSYRRVIDHFSGAKIVGITATPDRADEKAMGQVFESVAYVYEIEDAINDGWLCPIRVRQVFIGEINLSACRTTAGDLNQGDLNAAMAVEEALHGVVKATIEQSGARKTLVFTTSVENAKRLAEIFNRYKPNSARSVDGGTQIDDRRGILAAYKRGEFQYLTNCALATEGFDEPEIACVAMARPTKSRSLFAQMVGRGLRIHPSKPDGAIILEFTGNSGKHHLASSVDILGGRYEEDEVDAAQEIVKKNPGMRADEALAQAHAEAIEKAKRLESARRAQLQAQVQYTTRDFNPFDVLHLGESKQESWERRYGGKIVSEKQLSYLKALRIDIPKDCTSAQASRLIGTVKKREELGLANYRQVRELGEAGIPAINLSYKHACDLVWELRQNKGRRLDPEAIERITGRERQPGEEG